MRENESLVAVAMWRRRWGGEERDGLADRFPHAGGGLGGAVGEEAIHPTNRGRSAPVLCPNPLLSCCRVAGSSHRSHFLGTTQRRSQRR